MTLNDSTPLPDVRRLIFGQWVQDKHNEMKPRPSDRELARAIGISPTHLGTVKRGETGVKHDTVERIAVAFGASVQEACEKAFGLSEPTPEFRFAREMEPILQRAGKKRPAIERLLKRVAEESLDMVGAA